MELWSDSVSDILKYEDAKVKKSLGNFYLWEANTMDFISSVIEHDDVFSTLCNDDNEKKIIDLWTKQSIKLTPIVLFVFHTKNKLTILDGNHRFRVLNVFTQNKTFNSEKVLFITPCKSLRCMDDNLGVLEDFDNETLIKEFIPSAKIKAQIYR